MDYDYEDEKKPPVLTDEAIKSTDTSASRRTRRSPIPPSPSSSSSYVSSSGSYQMSPSKMMISSQMPPSKIQYPSLLPAAPPMQIESLALLDSSPSSPSRTQFINSSPSLPSSQSEEKLPTNEKEKILENILAALVNLVEKKKSDDEEDGKAKYLSTATSTNSVGKIPVVGQSLADPKIMNNLLNFGGKMVGALRPRPSRQSSPGVNFTYILRAVFTLVDP